MWLFMKSLNKIMLFNHFVAEFRKCSSLKLQFQNTDNVFTRDSIYAIARICNRNSVCLSVRLSHGWISQKHLKLGLCSFHDTVAPSL